MKAPVFKIGNKEVGQGSSCYVIAEIGSNHNQDFDLALKTIEEAAKAGVDAVKFQTFRAKDHVSKKSPSIEYLDNVDIHKLIKSLELNRAWQEDLQKHALSFGVDFFSSPCDIDAIRSLEKLDVPAYKVASFDLTDDKLITSLASTGKPVILSTGMATWMDIDLAIQSCKKVGNDQVALLQCTSLYPAPASLSNLRSMKTLRCAFSQVVGYSDHTVGIHIPIAAVAMGASILEKHITLDKTLPGPDHNFALEPKELRQMMIQIREIESAFGDGLKNGPREEEIEMAEKGRRSLHAKVDIKKGEIITDEMISIKRPGKGIEPFMRKYVIGRAAVRDIENDHWITWDMI